MKPCRKQNIPAHQQSGSPGASSAAPSPAASAALETPVHRYTHPIRTVRPAQRSTTDELLSYILEALSRQSEQLEELLRRGGGDNSEYNVNK